MTRCYAKTVTSTVAAVRMTMPMVMVLALAACGTAVPTQPPPGPVGCADVVGAEASESADGTFVFDVTVRSPDAGWDQYADLWEIVAPDGTVLGSRTLAHPHVDEQPFTRSLRGVVLPEDIEQVTVRARDLVEGFCGMEFDLEVTR